MNQKPLSVDLIRIDGDTQNRVKINEDVVAEYAEIIQESSGDWPFPPIDVFHDGTDYHLADGFHRLLAAQRAKRGSIPCVEHKGTEADARIFGMTANDKHGLRMTRDDKRKCVEWLLDRPGKMTQKEIAEKAGVSDRTVRAVVAERKIAEAPPNPPEEQRKVSATRMGGSTAPAVTTTAEDDAVDEPDYGKCPNCGSTDWDDDEDGVCCAKCYHPWGEPVGDVDEDRLKTQRQKTVKTAEALMRAFDDLQTMQARPEHKEAIAMCETLIVTAEGWK